MSDTCNVLLAEDDLRLARFTVEYLEQHGMTVTHVADGDVALFEAFRRPFDVVVLDWMLPLKNGLEVCRRLRERSDVPIVMITARTTETDKVLGLEIGADDYLTKPFSPRELVARIQAVVRRASGRAGPPSGSIKVGSITLFPSSRRVTRGTTEIKLTTTEYDLLLALAKRPGRVLSREQLLELVRRSADEVFDRAVDVHVSRLRQKLTAGDDSSSPVKTVRGVGYMLAGDEEA
jgi:two-component system, OmpR family, response regulator